MPRTHDMSAWMQPPSTPRAAHCLVTPGGGSKGGGWVGLWGGPPPPRRRPGVVRGAEGAEEMFWPKLTWAEGTREKF